MSTLAISLVTDDTDLQSLEPAWQALWDRVPGATPFQSPAWLLPWWRVFGTARPMVACLRDGNRLAGLLPLYVLEEDGHRKLLPLGIGISDYCDALLEPDVPDDAVRGLLAEALDAGRSAGARVCDLVDVPAASRLRQASPPVGWHSAWRPDMPCPVLPLPAWAADAPAVVPARQRRKLRMNRHRADRAGGWRLEEATRATAPDLLDQLLRLQAQRWHEVDPAVRQFHRAALPNLLETGLLRLAALHVAGRMAALCYALSDRQQRLMFYMIGFDPALAAVSPGSLLIAAMIDEAIARECPAVHFLRGGESYKYAWGAQDRHNASCRLKAA